MPLPDYYAILQVDPRAEQEIIDAAYRRLAARFHPHLTQSQGAASRMAMINEAYQVLSIPEKRRAYDVLRNGSLNAPIPANGKNGSSSPLAPPYRAAAPAAETGAAEPTTQGTEPAPTEHSPPPAATGEPATSPAPAPVQAMLPVVCANCRHLLALPMRGRDQYTCPRCGFAFLTMFGAIEQVQARAGSGLFSTKRLYRLVLASPRGRQAIQFETAHAEGLPLRQGESLILHLNLNRQVVLLQNLTTRRLWRI